MIRTSSYEAARQALRNPAYDGNPAINREGVSLKQMSGDQAKVVAAMIDVPHMDDPPRRSASLPRSHGTAPGSPTPGMHRPR